jgi:hypothetical protein
VSYAPASLRTILGLGESLLGSDLVA